MRYSLNINMDLKNVTTICESKGFRRGVVLKELFENEQLIRDICEDIISDNDGYWNALKYFNNNKIDKLRHIVIDLDCNYKLVDILREYHIKLNTFMSYIISNNVLNDFCDGLPNELKMKKYQ